jgi:hypothetical protein
MDAEGKVDGLFDQKARPTTSHKSKLMAKYEKHMKNFSIVGIVES